MASDTPPPAAPSRAAADPNRLDGLSRAANQASAGGKRMPPVLSWNPDYCGEIDMRIAADGTWFYNGTPIGRPALVKLFASILRKDPDRFVLVTPVERVGIKVDDAPFLAVALERLEDERGPVLKLRTNTDDEVEVDADHPLRFEAGASEGIKPYVRVRHDLWALVKRALFYDLVDMGEIRERDGERMFGVASAGVFFPIAPAAEVEKWQ
jgi:hypothetical protein